MKVIVISGGSSHVGKTRLSQALCGVLEVAVHIKIGHHAAKAGKNNTFYYNKGTGFSEISAEHSDADFLIIESNTILEEITPEITIYLPSDDPKPTAEIAVKKADIIRGGCVSASKIAILAKKLERNENVIRQIADMAGAAVE